MHRQRLDYIQLLRAVAAIAVVMFHATGPTIQFFALPARSTGFLQIGGYGVDLFFVISGFVIYYTAGKMRPGQFIRKRFERIVPIYWVISAAAAVLVMASTQKGDFTWMKLAMSLAFASQLAGKLPVVHAGWTLEYEMLFYLCVAMAMLLVRRHWALTCTILSTAITAGTLIPDPTTAIKFLTAPTMLEFLIGILIGQALIAKRVGVVEVISVSCAAIAVLCGPDVRPVIAGLASAALVTAAVLLANQRLPQWIIRLGDASYSIYLVQALTIPVCTKLVRSAWPAMDPDAFVVVTTVVTVLAGLATYSLVECRIRDALRSARPAEAPGTEPQPAGSAPASRR